MKKRIELLFLIALVSSCYSLKSMDLSNDQIDAELYDYHLYQMVQKIKKIVKASLEKNRVPAIGGAGIGFDSKADHPHPQTKRGLFLHIIGTEGAPALLSTPWGSTYLIHHYYEQAQFQPVVAELLSHLTIKLLSNSPYQSIPIQTYKIFAIDGDVLPLPEEQEKNAYSNKAIDTAFDEFALYKKKKLE